MATATSSSITYTYKERGGLRAIQIAESKASSNEVDYIVEQGTSGIWTYRKWNSGISECWGTISWSITSWTAWGSVYYSTYSSQIDYPTNLFINIPTRVNGNAISNGDSWIGAQNNGTSSKTPSYFLMRGASGSSGTGYVFIHAYGTWK